MRAAARMMRRAIRQATLPILLAVGPCACFAAWPTVPRPPASRAIDMGPELLVNGVPTRMQGHESKMTRHELADWFRASLGKPLVENTIRGKLILARAEGPYYVMVQIEAAKQGARAVVAVSDLKTGQDNQGKLHHDRTRWLSRLPAGTHLVSLIDADDAGRASRHWVFNNHHPESLNVERLKRAMADDGFALEREQPVNGEAAGSLLFFKGQGKEGMATVQAVPGGGTTTVLATLVTGGRAP